MEPHTSAHEVEAERFARHLAGVVKQSHVRGEFESLAIASPPYFLVLMRAALDPALERLATGIAKDLSKLEPGELMDHVAPMLWPGS
jgi:protein required for attachment to host cells